MTDQLIMTTAQRDKQYAALENSIDAVTQEITDHKVMWGEEAIPSRVAQRQNLVLKEREHKDAMEMLQSLPMVTDTPKAYILQNSEDSHKKLSWVENVDCESIPLFTSPQALTPITADDVTDEMHETFNMTRIPFGPDREIMAAAYNAVIKHRGKAR